MKTKAGAILSSIRIDRSLDRKISVQLYMGLRDIILSGGLNGGERLPATRTLASANWAYREPRRSMRLAVSFQKGCWNRGSAREHSSATR
jgi:hypothetical protein